MTAFATDTDTPAPAASLVPATAPGSAFWDRVSRRYARKPIPDAAAYAETLEATARYLSPDDEVLELGCGTGLTATTLAPRTGRYLATDFSEGMIEIARERAWDAGLPNLSTAVAAPGDEALEGRRFDAVLAFNLVHLIADTDAFLAHVRRMVRPGGLFVSKTPCLAGNGWRTLAARTVVLILRRAGIAPPVTFLTAGAWEAAVRRAGFDIVETRDIPRPSRFVVARRPAAEG